MFWVLLYTHFQYVITKPLRLSVCVCVCVSWPAALLRPACADGPWRQTDRPFSRQPQPQLPAVLGNSYSRSTSPPAPNPTVELLFIRNLKVFQTDPMKPVVFLLLVMCRWTSSHPSGIVLSSSLRPGEVSWAELSTLSYRFLLWAADGSMI